ncbi:BrnA antitoxin family protein [Paracoccus sp. SY]|uniref:BrnA antitoxin family protein n=1 Tax=Paracoccus sp. SY TaxID=1330255 RepID=UPI000CD240A4|nr:BrnA antitoxin family protein [Paracoccus sp. SY]
MPTHAYARDEQFAQARSRPCARLEERPKADNPKIAVFLLLVKDVVAWFKASKPGWQTRMSRALRDAARL